MENPEERSGAYIQTFTGRQFFIEDPRPEDVDIRDIAHALSMICRFTGHVSRFYSVAEHSLLVAKNLPVKYQAFGLLHDASEAYLTDVSGPLKSLVALAEYKNLEIRATQCIFARFGLPFWIPEQVKSIDRSALVAERNALFSLPEGAVWSWKEDLDDVSPLRCEISGWVQDFSTIEREFLDFSMRLGLG